MTLNEAMKHVHAYAWGLLVGSVLGCVASTLVYLLGVMGCPGGQ